ncbi:MAG: High-affnity carbon uptake protein Hat/HatR [uncultured Thermomicrobiales bacterium]|uniref:High-affnity carbon uptake protein Hat/HatR n=1 Tax=uncultured Thermomicrobiales bacterium TaxID=1645740 RepID=A0A6J4U8R1_9BACT|nr:MAG: High-affnity carbon uptake protein Hat/HatR [uncultured Thermomicrobiales bacterium]
MPDPDPPPQPPTATGPTIEPPPAGTVPRRLTGRQRERLVAALVDAFPSGLAQLAAFRLDVDLAAVASEKLNLSDTAFALVRWAETRDRLSELYLGARELNPGNPRLRDWALPGDPSAPHCPYRGLFAFREEDARFFFGREAFTDRLLGAVGVGHLIGSADGRSDHDAARPRPLVAVVGSSGSGKSSVVFAGLVPRLQTASGWAVAAFRPGARPLDALAAVLVSLLESGRSETDCLIETPKLATALREGNVNLTAVLERVREKAGGTTRLLLVADQFEEAYTLCRDDRERGVFLDVLLTGFAAAAETRPSTAVALLTMRADFLGQALAHRPMADALQDADLKLGPMTEAELRAAIERPATLVGVGLEAGLADRILEDVTAAPGGLPLLEFALAQLWEEQAEGMLTHAGYEAIGGVEEALARHADDVCGALSAEEGDIRRVFTQLVRPEEETTDTRRRATRGELGEEAWALVARLADERLVVTGRDEATGEETVEVVHEALIGEWAQLREWMGQDRAFRLWQERLRAARRQWEASKHDPGALLRGAPLAEAEGWLERRGVDLGAAEREFVVVSVALRDREITRQHRFRWAVVATSLAAALVALTLASWAWSERGRAEQQAARAEQQAATAQSLQLVAQSKSVADGQFDLDLLLGLEAVRVDDSAATRGNVIDTMLEHPHLVRIMRHHADNVLDVAYSKDGATLASSDKGGRILLWDPATGQPKSAPLTRGDSPVPAVAFVDDDTLVWGGGDGSVTLWDIDAARPPRTFAAHVEGVTAIAVDGNGRMLATGGCERVGDDGLCNLGEVRLWDLHQPGKEGVRLESKSELISVQNVSFDQDGAVLAAGGCGRQDIPGICSLGLVRWWDVATAKPRAALGGDLIDGVASVAFSPDGKTLAAGSCGQRGVTGECEVGAIHFWATATGKLDRMPVAGHEGLIHQVAFGSDGTLASAGGDGTIILWNAEQRKQRETLQGHDLNVIALAFAPGSSTALASGSRDNAVILWETKEPPQRTLKAVPESVLALDFPDNATLVWGGTGRSVVVWDVATDRPRSTLVGAPAEVSAVGGSPDASLVAAGGCGRKEAQDLCLAGGLQFWRVADGQPIGEAQAGHAFGVTSLAFASEKRVGSAPAPLAATAGCGERDAQGKCSVGEVRLWDPTTAQPVGEPLQGELTAANAVAFSPDGTLLAAGGCLGRGPTGTCAEGGVQRWETASGRLINGPLRIPASTVRAIAFSPDGRTLAAGGQDGTVILWDIADGTPRLTSLFHVPAVRSLAFSPDGEILAAGTEGGAGAGLNSGKVALWDVGSGGPLGELAADLRLGRGIAFSPDGMVLAVGGAEGSVVLWDGQFDAWRAHACARANRSLSESERVNYLGSNPPLSPTCPTGGQPALQPPAASSTPAIASTGVLEHDEFAPRSAAGAEEHVHRASLRPPIGGLTIAL